MKMAILAAMSVALLSGNLYGGEKCCGGSQPVEVSGEAPLPPATMVPANAQDQPCYDCDCDCNRCSLLGPIAKGAVKTAVKSCRRMKLAAKSAVAQVEAAGLCREEVRLMRQAQRLANETDLLETAAAAAAGCYSCDAHQRLIEREQEVAERATSLECRLSNFASRQHRHHARMAEIARQQAELQAD